MSGNMWVVTVSPNAPIDRVLKVDHSAVGEDRKWRQVSPTPAGKRLWQAKPNVKRLAEMVGYLI